MTVHIISKISEFARFQHQWDLLAGGEFRFFPQFTDVYDYCLTNGRQFRLIVAEREQAVQAIACFVLGKARRGIWLGERRVLDLPVNQAVLQGSAMLGAPDATLAAAMLDLILTDPEVDLVELGDVDKASGLYAAARQWRWKWLKRETEWRTVRRMIVLPATFRDYLASLRSHTRKGVTRDQRIFAKLDPEFRVMTRPGEMGQFLADATRLGDKTYQAGAAFGIDASDWRRHMLETKAEHGKLVAFLAYVNGNPCAFCWGEISYDVFYFRHTGYDPAYRRYCPGTAILLNVIEHLITNRICARFDFGIRDMPYKERFATHSIACANIVLANCLRPSAALVVALERLIASAKPLLLRLVGGPAGLQKIKKIMRR